jgi:lambda repressor-like predicted transcriptional regulator
VPNNQKTIEEVILATLKERGISINKLSSKTSLNQSHLTKILRPPNKGTEKRKLSQPLLDKINNVLNTDFKLDGK